MRIRARATPGASAPASRNLVSTRLCSGGRCDRLALFQGIRNPDLRLCTAGLTACMRRSRWDLESITRLQHASRLTFDRELEAAFKHIGRLDPRMRVPPDRRSGLDFRLNKHRYVSRRRTVGLRQDLSRDTR